MRCAMIFWLCSSAALAMAGDPQRPAEPKSDAELTAEVLRLRAEVDLLRSRIERLRKAIAVKHPGVDGAADKDRLRAETKEILAGFNLQRGAVWKEAHDKIRKLRQKLAASLQQIQDRYTRDAKLDEAVAVRDLIRSVKAGGRKALPDPGILNVQSQTPQVLFFRVTGANAGTVWGTDIYTSDCSLATATVHAGVLKVGQTGVVKVTTIPHHPSYVGSTRNGITSHSYGPYTGFRVQAVSDEDEELSEGDIGEVKLPEHVTLPEQESVSIPAGPMCGNDFFGVDTLAKNAAAQPETAESMPAEARHQIDRFEAAGEEIRNDARQKISAVARETIAKLTPIQDAHTRAVRLDDAVVIRELIRKLSAGGQDP